ncbi:unnamed protein product, partial [Trichogramma brassicae]
MSLPAYHRWPLSRMSERGSTAAAERTQRTRNAWQTLSKWQEAWDPVEEGPMDAPTDPKHQSVDREEARRAELPPHAALTRGKASSKHHSQRYDHNQSAHARSAPHPSRTRSTCSITARRFSEEKREDYITTLPAPRGHDAGKTPPGSCSRKKSYARREMRSDKSFRQWSEAHTVARNASNEFVARAKSPANFSRPRGGAHATVEIHGVKRSAILDPP